MIMKRLTLFVVILLTAALLCGCVQQQPAAAPVAAAPTAEATAEPVTLIIAGGWPDCRALDEVAKLFTAQYPNCTIVYEYVQDYYASVEKRMQSDDPVDLFFTTNIQPGLNDPLIPLTLELRGAEGLDLSGTFDGLIQNFTYRDDASGKDQLYAVPLGADMRGLYVNKTILKSVGLDVPTNQAALLAACQTLKDAGYIPFHGNPGNFAQTLIYPWMCNLVANGADKEAVYKKIDAREAGVSELFREPYAFLYSLVENGYYDYKRAQTDLSLFNDTTDEAYARDFLNIVQKGEAFAKEDDVGRVAFMPSPISLTAVIAKTKEDYHSEIDYAFIPAPVGKDGGFAYLSPAHGIAVCKNSKQLEWAVRFIDFLFQPTNNTVFSEAFNVIPNTKDAFAYIQTQFDLPQTHIAELGQVTFSYNFYSCVTPSMTNLSKANNPKYMQDDGAGNLSLYPLDYYMEQLEADIMQQ